VAQCAFVAGTVVGVRVFQTLGNHSSSLILRPWPPSTLIEGIVASILRLIMEALYRFFTPPRRSFFLFGPRGTGKSTFVRQHFPDALCLDLLDPERVRLLSHSCRTSVSVVWFGI
jgi:hypothetical protein